MGLGGNVQTNRSHVLMPVLGINRIAERAGYMRLADRPSRYRVPISELESKILAVVCVRENGCAEK